MSNTCYATMMGSKLQLIQVVAACVDQAADDEGNTKCRLPFLQSIS